MQRILSMILTAVLMVTTMFGLLGEQYDVYEDIRYGEAERNLVSVYVPKNAYDRKTNGCVLILHGGSWNGGRKEDMAPFCKKIAMQGYIAATMSYSLCDKVKITDVTVYTMLDEITACIRALKQFSDQKKLHIQSLALSGYSAGGHLSMLYSYAQPQNAVIPLVFTANRVGPADLTTAAWGKGAYAMCSKLLGRELTEQMQKSGEADRLCKKISPVYYVTPASVPSIFAYAGNDPIVTKGNRTAMVNKFKEVFGENGNGYNYIFYPLSGHGLLLDPVSEYQYDQALFRYCKTYFGYEGR
ncbi:MAG: alpha/beta hydrolase [Clostridia bacterium]|nr:alpha/beta hydrolase [Clostridia bacterium]